MSSVSWWLCYRKNWSPTGKLSTLRNGEFFVYSVKARLCTVSAWPWISTLKLFDIFNLFNKMQDFFYLYPSVILASFLSKQSSYWLCAVVSFSILESVQLYHAVLYICVNCRLKEIPWNAEDVLFPSIHSGVVNHSPTYIYNMSFNSQVLAPPLIVWGRVQAFWL